MTDPTYAEFKRKERELEMRHAGKDFEKWAPTNRRREDKVWKFAERVCVVGLVSFGIVEAVYQVCLKVMR